MPPPATAGNQEGRKKGDAELQAKPALAEEGGMDRSGLKSSGRLRTGMLARSDVEAFSVCINQITTVC